MWLFWKMVLGGKDADWGAVVLVKGWCVVGVVMICCKRPGEKP